MKLSNKQINSDRFIPIRSQSVPQNLNKIMIQSQNKDKINVFVCQTNQKKKQLTFCKNITSSTAASSLKVNQFLNSIPRSLNTSSKPITNKYRVIQPYKIIDIPNLVNDFYFNPLDVNEQSLIGLGLSQELFIFREKDELVIEFDKKKGNSSITSLKFIEN